MKQGLPTGQIMFQGGMGVRAEAVNGDSNQPALLGLLDCPRSVLHPQLAENDLVIHLIVVGERKACGRSPGWCEPLTSSGAGFLTLAG